ncbi:hypothetical protein [Nitriliruptor alkaliphilus]|uniref:hypothetical protein n=1 Tax=Nitriliruptor alkaliphilus TaxID=427918 RepID=UPI0006988B48|nr:hypothetical protein [Nitriliruptor alkaliphilus]
MTGHRATRLAGLLLAALASSVLLPTAAVASPEPCADHLVTHRPDGTTGDGAAVAITAQALERGHDGWAMVAWEVAPATELRVIQVVDAGATSELPPDATIAEGDVEELRFCGARVADGPSGETADGRAPDGAVGVAAGIATRQLAAARAGTSRGDGTPPAARGVLGAAIGAAIGGVVLLLSRRSRHDDEVLA